MVVHVCVHVCVHQTKKTCVSVPRTTHVPKQIIMGYAKIFLLYAFTTQTQFLRSSTMHDTMVHCAAIFCNTYYLVWSL
jgi:hypothetical protein